MFLFNQYIQTCQVNNECLQLNKFIIQNPTIDKIKTTTTMERGTLMKCTQCFKCVKLCLMLSLIFYTLFRRNKLFIVIEKANSIFFRRKIILKVYPQLTQKEHSTFTLNKNSFHFTNPKSSNAQCTFFSLKKETKKKHNLKNANSKSLDQFSES